MTRTNWLIRHLNEFVDAFEAADVFYRQFFSDELEQRSVSRKLYSQYEKEDDALTQFLYRRKSLLKKNPLNLPRAYDFYGNLLPSKYREISMSPWVGYYLLDETAEPPVCGGVLFGRKEELAKLITSKTASFEDILKAYEPRIRT